MITKLFFNLIKIKPFWYLELDGGEGNFTVDVLVRLISSAFSFSYALRWVVWKAFKVDVNDSAKRSFCIFSCLWRKLINEVN